MSGYIGDIGSYLSASATGSYALTNATGKDNSSLNMTDFLTLMVTEMTNQSIDQTADTSDMLNQLVQMQMVQALVNMTDASLMTYAASLLVKTFTVGKVDDSGIVQQTVGTVTATGSYNGNQVVFIGDECYQLSDILAVGVLPGAEAPAAAKIPAATIPTVEEMLFEELFDEDGFFEEVPEEVVEPEAKPEAEVDDEVLPGEEIL